MGGEGERAPDVVLKLADDTIVRPSDYADRPLVIYFYPKDDTTGCTREAQDFSALAQAFAAQDTAVIGVSRDSAAKHRKFIDKHGLRVPLAADEDGAVCEAFGTWVEKSMYGRSYMGIERATFLIDRHGRIARVWRKVKVAGHAAQVLEAAKALA